MLEQLENAEPAKSTDMDFEFENDIPAFLSHFKIEPGEHFVRRRMLYKLYTQYSLAPVNNVEFGLTLGLFFSGNTKSIQININRIEVYKLIIRTKKKSKYTTANPSIRKQFERFKNDLNIVDGDFWIESKYLFYVYKKYCSEKRKHVYFSDKFFTRMCKLYFETKQIGRKEIYFKLNKESISTLTKEDIERFEKNGKKEKKTTRRTKSEKESKN